MIFIRDGTRVHKLLMLLACVGEYPMRSVYLLGNERVWKRKIRELQQWQDFCLPESGERGRFQMLTVSGKGKNVTIRLHWSALAALKRIREAAHSYYMEHFNQHHFSGAVTHVSRNHRLAETVAMCMAAGIAVLPWEKPEIHDRMIRQMRTKTPCCYLSRELKSFYEGEMKKTEFTRLTAAVVYPNGMYAVYNTRDEAMLWRGGGEEKAQILLEDIFRTDGWRNEAKSAILLGRDFRTAAVTLEGAFVRRHLKERLDLIYENLYFIPMNEIGIKMLGIMTQRDWHIRLRKALFGRLGTWENTDKKACDAYISGVYHYCHLDGDLCSLIRFRSTLRRWPEETYVLHCYREQIVYLKEYLGDYSGKGNLKLRMYAPETLHTHLQKA